MIKAPRAALVFAALGLALAGCVGTAPPDSIPSTPTSTGSPTPISSPSAPIEPASWAPSGTPVDGADYAHPDGGVAFASPSGNIQCGYTQYREIEYWWCVLGEFTVDLPPDPEGACTGTSADGTTIRPNGLSMDPHDPAAAAVSMCAGASEGRTLPYGSSLSYLDMGCDSTEDGMTCRSLVSGRGFRLSRSDYELF